MYRQALRLLVPAIAVAACSSATEPAPSIPTRMAQAANSLTVGSPGGQAIATPAVIVVDQYGIPMSGVAVTFSVIAGGGTVAAPQSITNDAGVASAGSWTLGPTAGENIVVANAVGAGAVTFKATGIQPGPPTVATSANLETGQFRLVGVDGGSAPFNGGGASVTGAVLRFRSGSFYIVYTLGSGVSPDTEVAYGTYQIVGFEIRLRASADLPTAAPVVATLRGDFLTFTAASYLWPVSPGTQVYARAPLGPDLSGTWNGSGPLAALDLKSFTVVLQELADGSLEGTWTGTRITCNCAASGYVFQQYSFAASDTVSIALQFGKPGDPIGYNDPYGGIEAKPTDASHLTARLSMAFDGDAGRPIYYDGPMTLSK
jgi:hypothetical protein